MFKVRHFANIGGSEEFVQELIFEMPTLVDAGMIRGAKRQQVKDSILAISFEGLMPAFEHLKNIRAFMPDVKYRLVWPDPSTAGAAEDQRRKEGENQLAYQRELELGGIKRGWRI